MKVWWQRKQSIVGVMLALMLVATEPTAEGAVVSKVLQEALEFTSRKFGKEVAEEGVERLTTKMSALALKHSDELVAQACRRVGPRTAKLVTEAGEQGDDVLRLLARHGEAAIPLATRKTSLGLVRKLGTEAGDACVKHGSIAEPILTQFGRSGALALAQVSPRSGRQLAMLTAEGRLKPELIDVVVRNGDKACEFLWRNKATLAGAAALAAFIAAPEEFLNGSAQLTGALVTPLADVPKAVALEAARQVPWTLLGLSGLGVLAAVMVWCAGRGEARWRSFSGAKQEVQAAWLRLKNGRRPDRMS